MATLSSPRLSAVHLQLAYTSLLRLRKAIRDSRDDAEDGDGNVPALELRHAYHALVRLRAALAEGEGAGFEYGLDAMIASMEVDLGGAQSLSNYGPGMDASTLDRLDIVRAGRLQLKQEADERAAASASCAADALWSSAHLYRHLNLMEDFVEAESARPWIEAMLFRTQAMLLQDGRDMSLHVANTLRSSFGRGARDCAFHLASFPGYIAAVVHGNCGGAIRWPTWEVLRFWARSVVFILEAKLEDDYTSVDIHNAVCELYVCGRRLGQKVVRGALCNGYEWVFLVLKFDDTGEGASYTQSCVVPLYRAQLRASDAQHVIPEPSADVIAGILLHWIKNGFSDVGEDDWFEEHLYNRVVT